jgi:hypothetical protein
MRAKLAGLILSCGVICSFANAIEPATAPTTAQVSTPELDKLAKQFAQVFGDDFEVQKSLATMDWEGVKTWLMEIKPRRAGVFVVSLDCRDTTPATSRFSPDRDQIVWVLDIGKENERRVLAMPDFDTLNPMPLACVGDTVILPIQLRAGLTEFHFSRKPGDPQFVTVKSQHVRDPAEAICEMKNDDSLKLTNQADEYMRVVACSGGEAMNEPGTLISRSMWCVMEAIKAGKFNLTSIAGQWQSSINIAVEIVPKGTAISVLARDGEREEFQGENLRGSSTEYETLPPGTAMMREGDQMSVGLWGDRVPSHGPKQAMPDVTIKKLPFAALAGPFPAVRDDLAK